MNTRDISKTIFATYFMPKIKAWVKSKNERSTFVSRTVHLMSTFTV